MAKKLRKRRMTPKGVILLLLMPWAVLVAVAVLGTAAGLPDYIAIAVALAASLALTYLIGARLPRRRPSD